MTPIPTPTSPLLTDLLLMPDGSVLADKLTPAMAEVLARIGLRPHAATHAQLVCNEQAGVKPEHRLDATGIVASEASTHETTTSRIEGMP